MFIVQKGNIILSLAKEVIRKPAKRHFL